MRFGIIPETVLDRVLLAGGLIPTPMADTLIALLLARSIMAGTKTGVFDALAEGPLSAAEVAKRCGTEVRATGKLLFCLAGIGYLRVSDGKYSLKAVARKWVISTAARSFKDQVLMRYLDLKLMGHAEEFLQTGEPVQFHDWLSDEEWAVYQKGQRSVALYSAPEVASRSPVPANPRAMLDIGGAHGYYSVAFCRRHRSLRSTILDLPGAASQSAPLVAQEDVGDRITYRAGNALSDELGEGQYDLVFAANVVHHFTESENRNLMKRIARALRPGGFCVILEIIRPTTTREAGQVGALLDFYFAITSSSGTWSFAEMASWQQDADLVVQRPIRLRMSPGYGLQAGRKGGK